MDNDNKAKDSSLIRIAKERGLVARSAALTKRGLETLQTLDRVVSFPSDDSLEGLTKEIDRLNREIELAERQQYQEIMFAFSELVANELLLIGDCSDLPYPKDTILYAIIFVVDDYEFERDIATDETLRDSYDKMIPTLRLLRDHLARDWHEIDPEDKPAIARLAGFESFPDWALPLKEKYIDDERASMEAAEVELRVLSYKLDRVKSYEN